MNLTINNSSTSSFDATACDSYDWNGVTYSESGVYTFNTTNQFGCDSTATLNLTINTASSSSIDVTACDSDDWNGVTYTESGTYTFNTNDQFGCDSTATLNLTINIADNSTLSITSSEDVICSVDEAVLSASGDFISYQWYNDDGIVSGATSATYTTSSGGNYYVVSVDSNGCSTSSEVYEITSVFVQAVNLMVFDNITNSTVSIDWDNASPSNIYNISYSYDGGDNWVDTLSHIGSFINLSDLQSSTTYIVEITSSAYGCESEVFSSTFTTEENCIVPENISLTATPFDVTLSWDPLAGVDSYKIVYNLPNVGWSTIEVTDTF